MEEEKSPIEFYTKEEIEKIINDKVRLYYADTGVEEVIVREEDIADFIMKVDEIYQDTENLKFIKVGAKTFEPSLTTYGCYLNKADPELRDKIIDRLTTLQTTDTPIKDFKIIDEDDYEKVESYLDVRDKTKSENDLNITDKEAR